MGKLAGKVVTRADGGVSEGRGLTLTQWSVLMAAWDGEVIDVFDEVLAEFSPAEVETVIALMGRFVDRLGSRDSF